MVSVEQAEQTILAQVTPFSGDRAIETIALEQAAGRILAETVISHLDVPHWDNSAMDGYALRYEDVQHCNADQPVSLDIVEEIPAGYPPQQSIQPGQAARIFTGAILPAGADTVVMQEDTRREGDRVVILTPPQQPQAFVRQRAAFYQAGQPLLPARTLLQAPEIAILAATQCARVTVYRRPRVAILSTGDELVGLDQPLQPVQIVDSNGFALAVLVAQAGAEPIRLGIVPDQPDALRMTIAHALTTADVILSSGGVSVGDYDYVDQILASLGADIHLRSVAVKPGKPLTFATFKPSEPGASPLLYFGLPGNPVSALVTFWRFVLPALRKLSGQPQPWSPLFVKARSRQDLRSDNRRESYLWGQLFLIDGSYEFSLAGGSASSANLINLAGTNGLAVLPAGGPAIAAGDEVEVMMVGLPLAN